MLLSGNVSGFVHRLAPHQLFFVKRDFIAKVYRWLGMIESGEYPTVAHLAEGLRLDHPT